MSLVRNTSITLLNGYHHLLVLLSLTLYKRFKIYQLENSPIVVSINCDGVIYKLSITRES